MAKTQPSPVNIGSLLEALFKIGRVTVANGNAITPYKSSDLDKATSGSMLKDELAKGQLPIMIGAVLAIQSGSVTFNLKRAKRQEAINGVQPEAFYDDATTITFTTSGTAIAAENGGFYADGITIGNEYMIKGLTDLGRYFKVTYGDLFGFPLYALECTAITGAWADIYKTNS